MKQGEMKLEKRKKAKQKLGSETGVEGRAAWGHNLWSRSPCTTAKSFEMEGQ